MRSLGLLGVTQMRGFAFYRPGSTGQHTDAIPTPQGKPPQIDLVAVFLRQNVGHILIADG